MIAGFNATQSYLRETCPANTLARLILCHKAHQNRARRDAAGHRSAARNAPAGADIRASSRGEVAIPESDQEEEYAGQRLDYEVHGMFAQLSHGISLSHRQGILDRVSTTFGISWRRQGLCFTAECGMTWVVNQQAGKV